MATIAKVYKSKFGEVLKPCGFKLYRNTFYRVVNDVMQTVMLIKTRTSCTIQFSIKPLVWEINDLYCEGYDVSDLRDSEIF